MWNGVLLTLPMVSSFLEAPILAWTDRARGARRFVVAGGLLAMAASVAIVSWSHGIVGIALAMLLYGPASGLALGTAESMLVDGADEAVAARRLARWAMFASLGDVLAPAIVALVARLAPRVSRGPRRRFCRRGGVLARASASPPRPAAKKTTTSELCLALAPRGAPEPRAHRVAPRRGDVHAAR